MATTTNYSWTTPDDTALVKDGAAAIRSLGTAIDSTVFTNAGAAVAKATVDAKGDLIAGTADNTIARLAVGANNTVLTADSTEATGLKWATPSSPAFNGARGYKTSNQSITSGAGTNVTWNAESYDTASYHDNASNNTRFTAPTTGYYLINCQILWSTNNTGSRILTIRKNVGADQMLKRWNGVYNNADGRTENITGILYLTATDYLVAEAYWDGTGSCSVVSDENNSYFEITYLGA
jgi:hypothetical protein